MPDGRALIRLARRHLGEQYILGAKVPKNNASWRGPWDCAEFTSWCAFQLTGQLFGCRPGSAAPDIADAYTGFWMDDARATGRIVTVGVEAMAFHKPVFLGDLVSFYTEVFKVGQSSITIKIESWALRHKYGRNYEYIKVTEGLYTYVHIDENRKPAKIAR